MEDSAEFEACQKAMVAQCTEIGQLLQSLREKTKDEEWKSESGISLLEVKNHQMVDYLINMVLIMMAKVSGQKIAGNPAIERLVELRTVLERMRPIEQKMQYQIEKLLSAAASGVEKNEEMKHRPRPEDLVGEESSESDEDSEGEGTSKKGKKAKKYLPPKLLAVPYDDGERQEARGTREEDESERYLMKKSMIYELQQQYSGAPEEVHDADERRKQKEAEKQRKKLEYEEENMVRLQMGKKERIADKKQKAYSTLDSLLGLNSFDSDDRKRRKSTGNQGSRKKSMRGKKPKRKSHH